MMPILKQMKLQPDRRGFVCAFLLLFALLGTAVPLSAQTILLVIQETAGGQPLTAPLPIREALAARLFDAGLIVFDLPGVTPAAGVTEISRLARTAGADVILEVQADYTDTLAGGTTRIAAHVTWNLIATATGTAIANGARDGSNSGHEREMDRGALGATLAAPIAEDVGSALAARVPPA